MFVVGDKVVCAKDPEPFIEAGVWKLGYDMMFDGVKMIDEVRTIKQDNGRRIYRIEDLWYFEDMLIPLNKAAKKDFYRIERCEKCGSPFIARFHFEAERAVSRKGNDFTMPGGFATRCLKCGFAKIEDGWSKKAIKAMEDADFGSSVF